MVIPAIMVVVAATAAALGSVDASID